MPQSRRTTFFLLPSALCPLPKINARAITKSEREPKIFRSPNTEKQKNRGIQVVRVKRVDEMSL